MGRSSPLDYTEFREAMRAKQDWAEERQERRSQRTRQWMHMALLMLAVIVLALVAFRLTR